MNVIPTELSQRLSEWVRMRVATDQSVIGGRVYFWRLFGVGLAAFGLGIAAGIGFYGYSFITRNADNMNILSSTFSKALADAELRGTAEGTVQIEPREIALVNGQTIALEPTSRVLLDPAAKVLVEGDVRIQTPPMISVPQASATRLTGGVPTITDFTVFKSIPFEKGSVVTGWSFLTSVQKSPTREFCHYAVNTETPGVDVRLHLGGNGKPEIPATPPTNFDISGAFERCVWFRSDPR
jgi:hypothetical protein